MLAESYTLQCQDMQIVFTAVAGALDGGYGYRINVRDGTSWRPVSAGGNPLVRGADFDLFPTSISAEGSDVLRLGGSRQATAVSGATIDYEWTGRVEADPVRGWFHFEVAVTSPLDLRLRMERGYEPEITLDLGPLPPYERGDHVWFKTCVANPTRWNDEAYGNDFPATYYYDPYLRLELLLFFDMTAMNWMSLDNIARFLNYRCGFRRRYRPEPAGEVGLYADGFSGDCFPAGEQRFRYSLSARERGDTPDAPLEQEALELLVGRCLELLPDSSASPWPAAASSWRDFSLNCARDMMDSDHCWGRDQHGEFILNYVDGYSPAWKEAIEARGRSFDMISPCLESALWALHPLATICAIEQTAEYHALQNRLLNFAGNMIREGRSFIVSGPARETTPVGTWQYVYIMEEAWQVAMFRGDNVITDLIVAEVGTVLMPLAQSVRHIFPLQFDKAALKKYGNGDGHAIAGLYALFMLDLHAAGGPAEYLTEAKAALRVLYQLPINTASQEVFLLAQGAQAAARLYTIEGAAEWAAIYRYLLAQTLRMMYWYKDETSAQSRDVNILGMFQACATIIYPALLENIDVVARLAATFKVFGAAPSLLNAINHGRINNFYFYPRVLPQQYHTSTLLYIPHENIPLLEGPESSSVGQEIYGAGFTFRAYLLWEAFGHSEDRDVMLLNLNNFAERDLLSETSWDLWFVAYNPTEEPKNTRLLFPLARGREAAVMVGENHNSWSAPEPLREAQRPLMLAPGQGLYLRLRIETGDSG